MPDEDLDRRCAEFDIHPTGPLPGRAGIQTERDAARLETGVLHPHAEVLSQLDRAGLDSARRSLRLAPAALWWALRGAELELRFDLPPGGYATGVLRELVSLRGDSISEDV